MKKFHLQRSLAAVTLGGVLLLAGCGTKSNAGAKSTTTSTIAAAGSGSRSGNGSDSSGSQSGGSSSPTTTVADGDVGPAGSTLVAAAPKGLKDGSLWGEQIVSAETKSGDPLVVFSYTNVNGDGNKSDDELLWSKFDHVSKTWSTAALIAKGSIERDRGERSFSVAVNQTTDQWAVAYTRQDPDGASQGISVYWSSDQGTTWKNARVVDNGTETTFTDPTAAYGTGVLAVSWGGSDTTHVATTAAPQADAATMKAFNEVPVPGLGKLVPGSQPFAVAVTDDDKLVLVYASDNDDAGGEHLLIWRQGSAPKSYLDTGDDANSDVQVAITRQGKRMLAVTSLQVSNADDAPVIYDGSSDDAGVTWSSTGHIAGDDGTAPFSLSPAITDAGSAAVTYYPNGSGGGAKCMSVKIAVSIDLRTWTPCVQPNGLESGGDASSQYYPAAVTVGNDAIWAIFQRSPSAHDFPAGIYAWPVPLSATETKP